MGLPGWLSGKECACNAKNAGLIHGSRRSPRGEHSNPLQYSCLENFMDCIVPGVQRVGHN